MSGQDSPEDRSGKVLFDLLVRDVEPPVLMLVCINIMRYLVLRRAESPEEALETFDAVTEDLKIACHENWTDMHGRMQ